jgi:hypothetical protein
VGSRGGGRLQIVASNLLVEGALRANGQNAMDYIGGGSGGSILLNVGTLSGAGTIQANGGASGYMSGAGGGGRVAAYAQDVTGFAPAAVEARAPAGAEWGTVFLGVPRRVTVRCIGAGQTTPSGSVVVAYGGTNSIVFQPEAAQPVQMVYADGAAAGEGLTGYDWINTGLWRGTLDDAAWMDRLLNGHDLDVVFSFGIGGTRHTGGTQTVEVPGTPGWVYTLHRRADLSGTEWQPVAGQVDVPCVEDGPFAMTETNAPACSFFRVSGRPAP